MSSLYIGLMSGTSLDGVDGVLVDLQTEAVASMRVLGHAHRPFETSQRDELLELNHSGQNELHRAALAGNALARLYAQLVADLLSGAGVDRRAVRAIGAHGQTLRHRPGQFDATGYTIQLNAPALLAEVSGIDVVCDFRSRDIAAGGQGAPLVPAFHCATFGRHAQELAVLNLGGISNLTLMRANAVTHGFDCGPGNALMDLWCQRYTGARFDDQGAWAARGGVHALLLEAMLCEPFFSMQPPKSSGRDLFNAAWLDSRVDSLVSPPEPIQVQATLAELTALVCARDVRNCLPHASLLVACGGGALNRHLMARLETHLPSVVVKTSHEFGLPVDQVEACAFAWLAQAFVERRTGNLPVVTGARGGRVLGALYPAQ